MAITTLPTGLRYPAHGEAANTWDDDINQGFIDHDAHQAHWIRSVPFREVHVNDDYGSDSNPSDAIGRPDYPYKTLAAAVAAIPNGGNIGQATGTHLILQGANALSAGTTTQTYATGGATITLPAYCWITGAGGDADRERASTLIEDTVSGGPLLSLGSRYIYLERIAVRNLSNTSGACGILVDTQSGGEQNFSMDGVHVYGCRQGVVLKGFNMDGSRIYQCQFSNNRREGLVVTYDGSNNSPNQLMVVSTDISQNNDDGVGAANVSLVGNSGGSANAVFYMCKIHGDDKRFDIQGMKNFWSIGGYYECGPGMAVDVPFISVTVGAGGAGAQHFAQNVHFVGNRFHSPHWVSAFSAGVPILGDIDKCQLFDFSGNFLDDNLTGISSTNPLFRFGADVLQARLQDNVIINNSGTRLTDVASLYSKNASIAPYNVTGNYLGDIW